MTSYRREDWNWQAALKRRPARFPLAPNTKQPRRLFNSENSESRHHPVSHLTAPAAIRYRAWAERASDSKLVSGNGTRIMSRRNMKPTDLTQRAAQRRKRIVAYRASGFSDADRWDLEYWQRQGPAARLSALVAIHADVRHVQRARAITGRQPGRR